MHLLRDQRPYLSNGLTNPWVSDFLEVEEAEEFAPIEEGTAGEDDAPSKNQSNDGRSRAPTTPRSDATGEPMFDTIVIYDTVDKPLLVSVSNPSMVAELPFANDYFVQRHRTNKREFVSSPELGLMMYAPWPQCVEGCIG